MKKLAILFILLAFNAAHASDSEEEYLSLLFKLTTDAGFTDLETDEDQLPSSGQINFESLVEIFKTPDAEIINPNTTGCIRWEDLVARDLKLLPDLPKSLFAVPNVNNTPPSNVLIWQALRSGTSQGHDAGKEVLPYWLHFQRGDMHYRLTDTDGAATLLTLYCVYAGEVHRLMSGLSPDEDPKASWDQYSSSRLKASAKAAQLLRHCFDRYKHFHSGKNPIKVEELETVINKINEVESKIGRKGTVNTKARKRVLVKEGMTLKLLYQILKPWLEKHYNTMEAYYVEATDCKTGALRIVRGLFHNSGEDTKWVTLGNTLNYLSCLNKFESNKPEGTGVSWLQSDLMTVLDANNLVRASGQGLFSDFREVVSTSREADGSVVVTTKYVPIRPEPRIAIGHRLYVNEKTKIEIIATANDKKQTKPKSIPTSYSNAVKPAESNKQAKGASQPLKDNQWKSVKKK